MTAEPNAIQYAATSQAPAGHDAAMIAAAEGNTPAPASRPEWLPSKFASPEAMATAYAELERKLGGGRPQQQAPAQDAGHEATAKAIEQEANPAAQHDATAEQANQQLAEKGIDYKGLVQEFHEKGVISPERYAELDAKGFPKEVVDSYIAGQQALANAARADIAASVGGEDAFGKVLEWAKGNLSEAQKVAWNGAIDRNAPEEIKMLLAGFKAGYEAQVGKEPQRIANGAQTAQSVVPYASTAEMTAAVSDRRYSTDTAYRAIVERRIAAMTAGAPRIGRR